MVNSPGLAAVWAESNTRESIYDALRRRETFATSGPRIRLRFFAGLDYPEQLINEPDLLSQAYAGGVPMGGELEAGAESPTFLISASADPGTPEFPGTDLQRLQVIKGWLDADGNTHEQVIDVAGNADNGAGVDPQSCAAIGSGERNLCTVWRDPNYKASQKAFYYVRVLENPTCRWSTLQCQSYGVNPFDKNCKAQADAQTEFFQDERGAIGDVFGRCCLNPEEERFYSPIIQERAWTSPIWINPGS